MAEARPVCPQCGAPAPAVTQYGLFDLTDEQIAHFQASGWATDGCTPKDFTWKCSSCKHEWPVAG